MSAIRISTENRVIRSNIEVKEPDDLVKITSHPLWIRFYHGWVMRGDENFKKFRNFQDSNLGKRHLMTRLKFSNFHVSISKCIISVTGRDIINLSNFSKNLIQEIESESIWGKFLSKFWSKIFGDFSVKKSWYRWFWFACCFFKWIIVFPSFCFSVMFPTFTVISRLNSRIFGLKNSVNWT